MYIQTNKGATSYKLRGYDGAVMNFPTIQWGGKFMNRRLGPGDVSQICRRRRKGTFSSKECGTAGKNKNEKKKANLSGGWACVFF